MIGKDERVLLQVWWTDCTNVAGGWHDEDDLAGFATDGAWECSNTGWLVYEDERCYVLAGRMTDDGQQAGLIERIPKAAVTDARRLAMPEYNAMIRRPGDEDGPDPLVPEPLSTEPKAKAKKAKGAKKAGKAAKATKKGK